MRLKSRFSILVLFCVEVLTASQEVNCPDIGTIFDQYSQTCFLLAGSNCGSTNLLECIPNSVCRENSSALGLSSCTCLKDLRPNAANFCYLEHETRCKTKNDLCDPLRYLSCNTVTSTCTCDEDSFYESDTCVRKAGTSCELGKQACGSNSHCHSIDGGVTYNCECLEPFAPNRDKQCKIPFDRPCSGEYCDPPFVCGEKRCECPSGSKYDEFTDTCFLLFNQTCSDTTGLQCYPGSSCSWRQKCICEASLSPNSEGLCVLSYEKDCEDRNDLCDTGAGLTCRNSRCECPYGKNWSEDKCLTVPGGLCFSMSECVPFAECVETAGEWNCQCVDNRAVNDLGFCFVPKDENCTNTIDCDPEQSMKCIDGICDCVSGNEAYIDSVGCRSTEGSICNEGWPPCVQNAECSDGRCACTDGHEGYLCLRSPGLKCSYSAECALGLECILGRCQCNLGYNLTPEIGCLPGYQTECFTSNSVCSETLICKNGFCDCEVGQVYSPEDEEECRSLVGSRCNNNTLICVNGATCATVESSFAPEGRCDCEEGFKSNLENICIESSGSHLCSDVSYFTLLIMILSYQACSK